jgi:uncharacterized protein YndB with AHSA1/START domain
MPTSPASDERYDLTATRVFDASVEEVWRAWTEEEQVKRWWGPHGFTVPVARMDVRVGGRSLVCMRFPAEWGGHDMYNTWTYTRVQPGERLEFTLSFSDGDGNKVDPAAQGLGPGIPLDVPHVITFRRLGDRRTEMTISEYGYTTAEARAQSSAGLDQVLDKMAASFMTA